MSGVFVAETVLTVVLVVTTEEMIYEECNGGVFTVCLDRAMNGVGGDMSAEESTANSIQEAFDVNHGLCQSWIRLFLVV